MFINEIDQSTSLKLSTAVQIYVHNQTRHLRISLLLVCREDLYEPQRSPLLSLTITTQTTRDALVVCASVVHLLPFVVDLVVTFSEGGFFKARLNVPPEFPLLPPTMRFIIPMWYSNSEWLIALRIHTSIFTSDSLFR